MQEEVEVQGKAGPGGRLDMNHGFVHHIRRNQIARDDYDREVKQAKEKQKKRYTPGPARPKKPDLQVYHPRQRATEKVHTAGALKDEPNDNGTQLFCLDFEADGGEVTSVIVYEDDDAEQLAAMISNQNQLEGGMREALKRRIQEEISKRRVQR
ncbi:hypothetical protein XENTR_v10009540 [Xenopus tropicalis]|uniref:UPF0561 protein C2orf68 homolog isoform X2 n=1 Tax=Xenopus tropicalis TaxID=8364 RepID=A0A8J0QJ72_XENTR|nr:UPF0561 protein C2orf68 homolog isoform X2 [Xenopus tropicalis]KAE8618900.1 hypothetical protein XENTR_v10009540 [Xenopus tropicalis]|eukprot:XP_002932586.1 PREDICTED: UPF0561 protein C2orf68 homolog isoform X2 [Xenopus tropicalis]